MQLYEYIAESKKTVSSQNIDPFPDFIVKNNKAKTNTLITKPDGKKYLIVDLDKLRR
jgi:NAD+--asparagine ADP-ribosyltransferase